MAASNVPPSTFSLQKAPNLFLILEEVESCAWVTELPFAEIQLADKLHKQLLAGAQNELSGTHDQPSLDLKRVAYFLASLLSTGGNRLAKDTRSALKSLGLVANKRGRPRGRKADAKYAAFVEAMCGASEIVRLYSSISENRTKYPRRWQVMLKEYLLPQRWPTEYVDLLLVSKTPKAFAVAVASEKYSVTEDRIARALRQATTSDQK